jgi:hypothetical protein
MITVRAQLIKVGGHNTSFGVDVEQSRDATDAFDFWWLADPRQSLCLLLTSPLSKLRYLLASSIR